MSSDLEARVEALETAVEQLREDGAATRAVAAVADRDVAELRAAHRATTSVLQSLRGTQLEQGQSLATLAAAVAGLATQIAGIAEGQARQREVLATHGQRLDHLTALVTSLADAHTEILRRLPPPPDQG